LPPPRPFRFEKYPDLNRVKLLFPSLVVKLFL
jgi:hypothetical protein